MLDGLVPPEDTVALALAALQGAYGAFLQNTFSISTIPLAS